MRPIRSVIARVRQGTVTPNALLLAATVVGASTIFWLVHQALVDDAYITLTYARTLADHADWGMLPGHEANTATSPLNVLLLGGLATVVGDPVLALGVLYVLTCLALAFGLRGLGRALGLGDRVAWIGTPLLVASPLLASTIGLETMLVVAALAYLAWGCVRGNPVAVGLVAGVMLWLRLDTVVLVAGLVLATPALWRRLHVAAGLAAGIVGPWLVFSWFVLGSAIPDTLLIKQGGWGNFSTGLEDRYSEAYTWATAGVFVVGALGVIATVSWAAWRRGVRPGSHVVIGLALAGAAYYLVMWSLDVPPFFWYYAPTLAALTLCAAIALAALLTPRFDLLWRATAVGIGGVALVVTVVPWWYGVTTKAPLRAMPMHANWALPGEYEEIGRELGRLVGDAPVHGPGEVGALAYWCECTIVDRFTDRSELVDDIREARDDSGLYRLNYHNLRLRDLERIEPVYRLVWRPGPDRSGRGWDISGILSGRRANSHFELVRAHSRTR